MLVWPQRQKPINYILYKKSEAGKISATIIDDMTVNALSGKFTEGLPQYWIETISGVVYDGYKPKVMSGKVYQECLEQSLFLAGKVGLLLQQTGKFSWMDRLTDKKIEYMKKNILPYGDDVEFELVNALENKISENVGYHTKKLLILFKC